MDIKDTIKPYRSDTILLSDTTYYKYIFKKTEKIVCTVFYVLEHTDKSHQSMAAMSVLESAKQALDAVLQTLSCRKYSADEELYAFLNKLVAFESNIRVAQAVVLLQEEIADMLSLELGAVMRALRHYLDSEKSGAPDFSSFSAGERVASVVRAAPGKARAPRENRKMDRDGDALQTAFARPALSQGQSKGQNIERRRAIKDILAVKRQSTIKDISGKMSDCSEKTLQREIVAMVNEGIIIKEGAKRWSRYSLVMGA